MLHIYYCFAMANIIMFILWICRVLFNQRLRIFFKKKEKSQDGVLINILQMLVISIIPIIHILTACGLAYLFIADESKVIRAFNKR